VPATFFIATGFLNGGRMWNDSVIEAVRNARGAVLDLRQVGLDRFTLENINQRRQGAENIIASVKHRDAADREKLVEDIASIVGEPLPDDLMMSDAQVVNLRKNGMEIGAHTVNHLILRKMGDKSDAEKEIGESRRYLEALLGEAIDFFAYPNGKFDRDYSLDHRDLVESMGFRAALSTEWGVSNRATDRFQLPRFTPWDKTPLRFTGRLINNYRNLR
jgi:peptidoglycan/xylan/chitin deacetylase (PgdA/CDA1 family)